MFCQEREANKSDVLKSGRMVMMSLLQRKEERFAAPARGKMEI